MRILLSLLVSLIITTHATAEPLKLMSEIRINGRNSATVTGSTVKLEDIADVMSPNVSDDDAVIGLKKIVITSSPKAGKSIALNADQILSKLSEAKVDLRTIGYTLPRTMQVDRAARTVSADEVRAAIEQVLLSEHKDVALRSISYREDAQVSTGESTIQARSLNSQLPGQRSFVIGIKVKDEPEATFRVNAIVEEWREVPVAARMLPKGSLISISDVAMARMNAANLPRDYADRLEAVVGYSTNNSVAYGEPLSRNKLELPPVVTAGSKVIIKYSSLYFEATATGIALDSGGQDQEIKVRNDSSKKIVFGKVVEPGLVKVIGAQ